MLANGNLVPEKWRVMKERETEKVNGIVCNETMESDVV